MTQEQESGKCTHYWIIDSEGNGKCKLCGATKFFENSKPTHYTFDGLGKIRNKSRIRGGRYDDL